VLETQVCESWLHALQRSLDGPDETDTGSVLAETVTWRDLLATSWDMRNFRGHDLVTKQLFLELRDAGAHGFRLKAGRGPMTESVREDGSSATITAFFEFTSSRGPSSGFVRLGAEETGGWQAVTLMTQLDAIEGHPELIGSLAGISKDYRPTRDRVTWAEARHRRSEFVDGDPQVVVIGAGHNGLGVAARLEAQGVSVLVLERLPRVGDSWRRRYSLLSLHDAVGSDHMPYMPLSPRWRKWTPKDKWADFLEYYAQALELSVWTGTTLLETRHDEANERWTLRVRRADGQERTLRPRHLIMATGLNGLPKVPSFDGSEDFAGVIMHASEYRDGSNWSGKNALVVGAGVTGHEMAQDLWEHGAHVTLLQRSKTHVVNVDTFHAVYFAPYLEGSGLSTEEADMVAASLAPALVGTFMKPLAEAAAEQDKETLDGLRSVGFVLDMGPNGGGILDLLLSGHDGYHVNTGAADLLITGEVALKQGLEIKRLTAEGAELSDGTVVTCDVIVLATGYGNVREQSRVILGDIVDRCGLVFGDGVSADGELGVTWRRSGVPGLWFMTGGIAQSRYFSKVLALQIKAVEEGLAPWSVDVELAPPLGDSKQVRGLVVSVRE
jgi:putative flavoprotein involved in K+ transport